MASPRILTQTCGQLEGINPNLTALEFDKFREKLKVVDMMNIQETYNIDRILTATASQDSGFGGCLEDIQKRKTYTKKGVYTTLGNKSIYKKPKLKEMEIPTV